MSAKIVSGLFRFLIFYYALPACLVPPPSVSLADSSNLEFAYFCRLTHTLSQVSRLKPSKRTAAVLFFSKRELCEKAAASGPKSSMIDLIEGPVEKALLKEKDSGAAPYPPKFGSGYGPGLTLPSYFGKERPDHFTNLKVCVRRYLYHSECETSITPNPTAQQVIYRARSVKRAPSASLTEV